MRISEFQCLEGVGEGPEEFVLAWASFPDGGGYFADGGCFVVFEARPGEFYVRHNLQRADPRCAQTVAGCTCPTNPLGRTSWDRRLYALTLASSGVAGEELDDARDAQQCDELALVDHAGERQPVSNDCRKYLYQLHRYDIPVSYLATGEATARRRLALFPTVELACLRDRPHASLPFRSLVRSPWVLNDGFVAADPPRP